MSVGETLVARASDEGHAADNSKPDLMVKKVGESRPLELNSQGASFLTAP